MYFKKLSGIIVSILFIWCIPMLSQESYGDDFSSVSYANNGGSANFLTNWVETGENTNPGGGRMRIVNQQLRFRNLDNRTITRTLDLAGAVSATLSLTYNRTSGNRAVDVQLFDGTNYATVGTLAAGSNFNFTLNQSQISANSGIRFISSDGTNWTNGDIIFIDNVRFDVDFANQPPVLVGTGDQIYCSGTAIPIAETISISDPDDTSTTAIYIQISSGYINGEDILTLTGSHPNIVASWDPIEGELTLQGPATYTEFESAILATVFSSSSANPTGTRQFSITVGEPNFLPSTGHYYEFVPAAGISWSDADAAASSRSYFGLQGYLVTLVSQEESDFSGEQADGFGWIGATDATVEGEWRWVTGPEAGTLFWTGAVNGTEITYANWNGGEPNDFGSGEDYAHIAAASVINGGAPIGAWNDLPDGGGGGVFSAQGYVVEYGGMPGDPVLNITTTTSITIDNIAPTWVTATGALDETYLCAEELPSQDVCTDLGFTFFGQQQFFWGFGLQNNTGNTVPSWEVRIYNANYQLDPSQMSNQSAFTYAEIDNGNGTYELILTGTSSIAPFSGIPGGNIQWSGVNFGFTPIATGRAIFCSAPPFPLPVATDNCGDTTVSQISDVITVNNGPNNFVRVLSYEAVDTSGNSSPIFTQTLTVDGFEILSDGQPTDVTAAGGTASFSVTATNVDTYQWQESTDGGITFTNLTNNAVYSGVQTATLNLNAPISSSMNGYQYRVMVSNSTSSCTPLTSNSATLSTVLGTVITNRRITFRVKKD